MLDPEEIKRLEHNAKHSEIVLRAKLKRGVLAEIETDLADLSEIEHKTDLEATLTSRIKMYKKLLNRVGINS